MINYAVHTKVTQNDTLRLNKGVTTEEEGFILMDLLVKQGKFGAYLVDQHGVITHKLDQIEGFTSLIY